MQVFGCSISPSHVSLSLIQHIAFLYWSQWCRHFFTFFFIHVIGDIAVAAIPQCVTEYLYLPCIQLRLILSHTISFYCTFPIGSILSHLLSSIFSHSIISHPFVSYSTAFYSNVSYAILFNLIQLFRWTAGYFASIKFFEQKVEQAIKLVKGKDFDVKKDPGAVVFAQLVSGETI